MRNECERQIEATIKILWIRDSLFKETLRFVFGRLAVVIAKYKKFIYEKHKLNRCASCFRLRADA